MSLIFGIVAAICILLIIVICVLIHFDKINFDIGLGIIFVIILVLLIIFTLSGVFCTCSDSQNSTGNTPRRWYYWLPTNPYGGGIIIPMD